MPFWQNFEKCSIFFENVQDFLRRRSNFFFVTVTGKNDALRRPQGRAPLFFSHKRPPGLEPRCPAPCIAAPPRLASALASSGFCFSSRFWKRKEMLHLQCKYHHFWAKLLIFIGFWRYQLQLGRSGVKLHRPELKLHQSIEDGELNIFVASHAPMATVPRGRS